MGNLTATSPPDQPEERPYYRLRLFVAGDEPNSAQARALLERLCTEALAGRYEIHIVDVFENYRAALENQVVAVPTLIVESPPPIRYIVGSLSEEDKVRTVLGLPPSESTR